MRIDLKKLTGAHGEKIPFSGSVDLSKEEIYGAYPFRHPAKYEGFVINHLGVLKLAGTMKTLYLTCCSRCLEPLEVLLTAQAETVLSREDTEEEDDVFPIDEDAVDPEDVLVPELLLQVRMTYLCKEDCAGLCAVCGTNRNAVSCSCDEKQIDPRFAALAALLKDKEDQQD